MVRQKPLPVWYHSTMSTHVTQVEYEWAETLEQAEREIGRMLSLLPKDKVLEYTRDLTDWAKRVSDENVAKSFRILNSLGYSRAACATTLGISPQALSRILQDHSVVPRPRSSPLSFDVPDDFIDITEQFAAFDER